MTEFKDHFSAQADAYARYRPAYPPALFAWLASVAPTRRAAWDCATGNGQAALGLAEHFERVVGTDASEQQLARAFPHPRVEYPRALAERSGLPDAWAGVVTVAQALHWFDQTAFFAEARRVLVPGGVLAVWAYGRFTVSPSVDAVVERLYTGTVGPWWPPERALIDRGYPVVLPFSPLAAPPFAMEREWGLAAVLGYLRTWSAVRRYQAERGSDPVAAVEPELARAWGGGTRRVRWPVFLHAGRTEDETGKE